MKIALTNDERAVLAIRWFGRNSMVSRKEVNEFIHTQIQVALSGICPQVGVKSDIDTDAQPESITTPESKSRRDQSIPDFVPSRGDEPYLYRPKDPELAAACSTVLDGLEHVEQLVWNTLERNRA